MATTFRPIVSHYRREDGTYRVCIRITHARKYKDIGTPFYVTADQITRGFNLKDQTVIDKVNEKIKEYRDNLVKIGFVADSLELKHLIRLLEDQADNIDFFEFADRYIKEIRKDGRDGTADMYTYALNSFKKFVGKKQLFFSQMNSELIRLYFDSIKWMKANTQVGYIGLLGAIYHKAQKVYNDNPAGIDIVKYGIFDNLDLPQKTKSKENVIKTVEQMQALIDCPYKSDNAWAVNFSKDMFLLSFMCFGTNMADFIRMEKSQYRDGVIYYRRKKTGRLSGENVDMQIKVPEAGRIILDKYSGDPKYLIDFGKYRRTQRFTKFIHYFFGEIGLEPKYDNYNSIGSMHTGYTFYSNRHTMASMARNICGVEYMTVHEMLNHAAPSNFKTTDVYLFKGYDAIWEANEKLYNLFDWSFYLNQKKSDSQ